MSDPAATGITDFLRERLNRRSVAFLLCLLMSALFWLLISLSKEYVDQIKIPVNYEHLPENLLVVNQPTQEVTAEVRGFGFDLLWYWLQFEKRDITVFANPDNLPSVRKKGELFYYQLTGENIGSNLKDGPEILSIHPDTLFLQFKPLFKKLVPVKLNADITFVKQYGLVDEPIIEPDSIEISGLEELVKDIPYIETEKQQWMELDESLTAEVALVQHDNGRLVRYDQNQVQVAVNVVEFTEGMVKIPIAVEAEDPGSVKVFPSEVEVRYQVPLADYEKVTANLFHASVTVDQNSSEHLLSVQLDEAPVQVRQTRLNPAQVEYILQR